MGCAWDGGSRLCHQEGPSPHQPPKTPLPKNVGRGVSVMLGPAAQPGTGSCSFAPRWCCRRAVIQQGRGQGGVTPSAGSVCVRWGCCRGEGCALPLPPSPTTPPGTDPAGQQGLWASGALPSSPPSCQAFPGVPKAPLVSVSSDGGGQRCWGPSPGAIAGMTAGCACAQTCQGTEGEESLSCGSLVFLNK